MTMTTTAAMTAATTATTVGEPLATSTPVKMPPTGHDDSGYFEPRRLDLDDHRYRCAEPQRHHQFGYERFGYDDCGGDDDDHVDDDSGGRRQPFADGWTCQRTVDAAQPQPWTADEPSAYFDDGYAQHSAWSPQQHAASWHEHGPLASYPPDLPRFPEPMVFYS